ncbi:RNA polymerase factor sigma-54 [Pusillimonas sp. TS35]|uniref:RNA polymerase factor sigma-54 n=1 Tax=Paracandidimonas lactea TaxID=2895524 RepID=UPI00136C88D3|nr:RNA polymerase factor sigma-54 [Pusillimonas sp. TS35]
MTQISYALQAKQQTTLTPRLQQSVRLLQMSTLDFNREVAQAIASNPFLEEHDEESSSAEDTANPHATPQIMEDDAERPVAASNADALGSAADDAFDSAAASPDIQQLDAMPAEQPAYAGDYPSNRRDDMPDTDVGQWAHSEYTLQDALLADLCGFALSERDRCLAIYVIEAIDDDGYLRTPLEELAGPEAFAPPVKRAEWETALRLVQHLGAPGVGARTLSECLTLQLQAMEEDTPGRGHALRIVQDQLERLGRCDYAGIARAIGCTETEAREGGLLIRGLTPRPGHDYGDVDPSCYVVPDAFVRKAGKAWVASSNPEAVPRARLNDTYAKLFRQTRHGDRAMMSQALQEARWLMRSLEQRTQTIQRVAQAIVARQQTFFEYGDVALRPLMLSEIAQELEMHESTVSRATSNKYLATPRGIYEFKHFFTRELATRSGGTCSAGAVRALIQEMIDEENPREPLSDVVLASMLAREGIMVARRTVSKYRAQIKYPPAELRRAP